MKVQVAQICGFCMGVRRAMDLALDAAIHAPRPVYTYGPLIHNPSALELLRSKGIEVLHEIPKEGRGTVIIRAHGIPPSEREALTAAGFHLIDGTCTRVVKVQMLAKHYSEQGVRCVLIGDRGHPEVKGIMGHAGEQGILVSSREELEGLELSGPYIVLAQTTRDREEFEEWSRLILERFPGGKVFNTVCDSTKKRQREVRRLCKRVECVVVVGGRQSANTRRLAEIAAESGRPAVAVETEEDLDLEALRDYASVGVTAGASTPNWIINRVVAAVEQVPGRGESALRRFLYRVSKFLHQTTLWTAAAGGLLALSAGTIQGIHGPPLWRGAVAAALYIFAMHTMNRILDRESGSYNDPMRALFLLQHRRAFQILSLAALGSALILALSMGWPQAIALLLLTLLGLAYTVRLAGGRALKDLPASKTLFTALAWTAVTALLPWHPFTFTDPGRLAVAAEVLLLTLARSALMEILDIHGDRIVGRETMAVVMGEEGLMALVAGLLVAMAALAAAAPMAGLGSPLLSAFLAPAAWGLFLLYRFRAQRIRQNMRLECQVELLFWVLAAATAALRFLLG